MTKKGEEEEAHKKNQPNLGVVQKPKKVGHRKAPHPPMRPPNSGYSLFMKKYIEENDTMHDGAMADPAVREAGGAKWRQMSEEEKAVYERDAEARIAAYDQAMSEFKNPNKARSSKDGTSSKVLTAAPLRSVLALRAPALNQRSPHPSVPPPQLPPPPSQSTADLVTLSLPAPAASAPVALPPTPAPVAAQLPSASAPAVTQLPDRPLSADNSSIGSSAGLALVTLEPPPDPVPASITSRPSPKRKFLVVIELDGLLCRSEYSFVQLMNPELHKRDPPTSERSYSATGPPTPFGGFKLYWRPNVREFLKFLLQNFHVVVWSRFPKQMTDEIVSYLFYRLPSAPLAVLSQETCTRLVEERTWYECPCPSSPCTEPLCRGHPIALGIGRGPSDATTKYLSSCTDPSRDLELKVMHKVIFEMPEIREKFGVANASNTLLVDCRPESSMLNPVYNCIFPLPYLGSRWDCTLPVNVQPYLEGLAGWSGSVPEYLQSRGQCFGETPIGLSDSVYGIKVHVLARLQDRSLVLPYPHMISGYRTLASGSLPASKAS